MAMKMGILREQLWNVGLWFCSSTWDKVIILMEVIDNEVVIAMEVIGDEAIINKKA